MFRAISKIAASCLLASCGLAQAAVVGSAVGPTIADDVNVNSFTIIPPSIFDAPAAIVNGNWVSFGNNGSNFSDNFGLMARAGGNEAAGVVDANGSVNLFDDSPTIFTGDTFGFVAEDDFDNFFGIIDTANIQTGFPNFPDPPQAGATGIFEVEWEFDITGAQDGLQVSIDFAAMGDLEGGTPTEGDTAPDLLQFDYSFDGVNFAPAFLSGILDTSFTTFDAGFGVNPIDQAIEGQDAAALAAAGVLHTMDGGAQVGFNDPLTINGEVILNDFETVTAEIGAPTSNTLTLRLTSQFDSGSEAAAFRNIVVEDGVAVGPTLMADFNGDGNVDLLDLDVLGANFGTMGGATMATGDANGDGNVDLVDLDILGSEFGMGSGSAVPEPASAALLALAAAGLACRRR